MKYITVKNYNFIIDTNDWNNSEHADYVSGKIESALHNLDVKKLELFNNCLKQDDYHESSIYKQIQELCNEQANKILMSYENTDNLTGHNSELLFWDKDQNNE